MAKGYSGYINYQWKRLQKELLLDACLKLNWKDPSEDLDLFEEVIFKEDKIVEERKHEIALYPMQRYLNYNKI